MAKNELIRSMKSDEIEHNKTTDKIFKFRIYIKEQFSNDYRFFLMELHSFHSETRT
mgnify:CR=1 FL=1